LLVSQMLTLYTTPVVYLYLDRLQRWCTWLRQKHQRQHSTYPSAPRALADLVTPAPDGCHTSDATAVLRPQYPWEMVQESQKSSNGWSA